MNYALTLSASGLNNCDSGIMKVDPKSLSIMVCPSCKHLIILDRIITGSGAGIELCRRQVDPACQQVVVRQHNDRYLAVIKVVG